MYHIFQVYDYKGGKLFSETNLTQDEFISNLIKIVLCYDEIDLTLPTDRLKLDLLSSIKPTTDYVDGEELVVLSCFKSVGNSLIPVNHEKFIETNYKLFIEALKSNADS